MIGTAAMVVVVGVSFERSIVFFSRFILFSNCVNEDGYEIVDGEELAATAASAVGDVAETG